MDRELLWQYLVASIRYCLKKEAFPQTLSSPLTGKTLLSLYALAKEQNVTHLVAFALKGHNLLPKEEPVSAAFEKSILSALYLTERIEAERKSLCALLEKNEIPHVALKGAVIRHLYPETWMRTSTDADVLVPEDQLEKAQRLLEEERGYILTDRGGHDLAFQTPKGLHMELHFALVEKDRMPEASDVLFQVWDYASPVEGKQFENALGNEFFLFYHLAHMAKHLNNGGVGLRFFVDLALILEKMPLNEKTFSKLAEQGGIAQFARISKELALHFTEGKPLSEEGTILKDFVLESGIFGKTETYVAIRRGRKGKLRYLSDRLFPSYEALVPLYPNLKGKKILLPFYQICRIGRHLKDGGLKRSGKEFSQNLSQSKEGADKMSLLLSSLGLDFCD